MASYNIHRAVGRDGVTDPERVAAVIREMSADVVALQEVSVENLYAGASPNLECLEQGTGLSAVFAPTMAGEKSQYGNALLTSGAILSHRQHDLSVPGREPRGALEAKIELADRTMTVIVTHAGLDAKERKTQVAQLSRIIPDQPPILIVAGDFNEWRAQAKSLRPLDDRLGVTPAPRTFPARIPLLPLDRIWVRPRHAVLEVRPHRSALALVASDHLPVLARVSLVGT